MLLNTAEKKENLKLEIDNCIIEFLEKTNYIMEPNTLIIDRDMFLEYVTKKNYLSKEKNIDVNEEGSWKWMSNYIKIHYRFF